MTAKDYLLRAWQIDARIDEKIAEIEHLEEKRERIMAKLTAGRASNLSGMPRGGRYDWTESVESVIETDELIRDAVAVNPPPSKKGKAAKIFFATQADIRPPKFILFVNEPELMHFSYLRFIENRLREMYGFEGTPLRLIVRARDEEDEY